MAGKYWRGVFVPEFNDNFSLELEWVGPGLYHLWAHNEAFEFEPEFIIEMQARNWNQAKAKATRVIQDNHPNVQWLGKWDLRMIPGPRPRGMDPRPSQIGSF